MRYFLGFDTETGGIGDDKSLLTAYFGFYELVNGKFNKLDELDLKIKPNDNVYHLTAESLDINKINIIEHNKVAIFEKIAGQQLYKKLQDWQLIAKDKLIPVGHNVGFDIRKVTTTLISMGSWESFVSYRVMFTRNLYFIISSKMTEAATKIVGQLSTNTIKLSNCAGIHHEAKCDVEMTMGVLENLMKNL